ncbi:MAG TPA: hypothetical protein VK071_12365 [Tissierellales bacterium]|nr:hypothetical protein [Tissierellales bacterium]
MGKTVWLIGGILDIVGVIMLIADLSKGKRPKKKSWFIAITGFILIFVGLDMIEKGI